MLGRGYSLYPHGNKWVLAELPNGRRTYLPDFVADGSGFWTMYADPNGHDVVSQGNGAHHRKYASDFFDVTDPTAPATTAAATATAGWV